MSRPNEKLQNEVIQALSKVKAIVNGEGATAVRQYNEDRKEATLAFGEVMSRVWGALDRGEEVGGCLKKEEYCATWNLKIRWVQKAIDRVKNLDTKPKASSVRFAAEMIDNISWDAHSKKLTAWVTITAPERINFNFGVYGSLTIGIPCESAERRGKVTELEAKMFDTVKQFHLMTKLFKAQWEETAADFLENLPKFLQPKTKVTSNEARKRVEKACKLDREWRKQQEESNAKIETVTHAVGGSTAGGGQNTRMRSYGLCGRNFTSRSDMSVTIPESGRIHEGVLLGEAPTCEKCIALQSNIAPEIRESARRQKTRIAAGLHPINDGCPDAEEEAL